MPPPIIERFELTPNKIENYWIEDNDDCVVIDISLSDMLHFDQYSFIATEIERDKEKLCQKYEEKKYQRQIEDLRQEKHEIEMHPDSDSMDEEKILRLQQIACKISEIDQKLTALNKNENEKDSENYFDEESDDDDDDILNDFDKRKLICPSLRDRGYCNRRHCDYKYHPQMERNVDFGNESTKWINPNLHKIHSTESAHKHPRNINEEFLNYLIH